MPAFTRALRGSNQHGDVASRGARYQCHLSRGSQIRPSNYEIRSFMIVIDIMARAWLMQALAPADTGLRTNSSGSARQTSAQTKRLKLPKSYIIMNMFIKEYVRI